MERKRIKKIAVGLVERDGLINLSRAGVCKAADIPNGSFPHLMGCTFSEFVEELRKGGHTGPVPYAVVRSRAHPELRKEHILNTAVELAGEAGYDNLKQSAVAEKAGVSGALVGQYFSMAGLKNAVMAQAMDLEVLEVVAQGIVNKHPRMKYISTELRKKAINYLTK